MILFYKILQLNYLNRKESNIFCILVLQVNARPWICKNPHSFAICCKNKNYLHFCGLTYIRSDFESNSRSSKIEVSQNGVYYVVIITLRCHYQRGTESDKANHVLFSLNPHSLAYQAVVNWLLQSLLYLMKECEVPLLKDVKFLSNISSNQEHGSTINSIWFLILNNTYFCSTHFMF